MQRIVTPPAAYPVLIAEAKEWCRVDTGDTSQDNVLDLLIAAMTGYAEHLTGRAFVQRAIELNLDCFEHCITLPWAPLLAVDSVKYTDLALAEQTVASSDYEVDTVSEPGLVRPVWGAFWPAIGTAFNPVRITYRAGYAYAGSPTDYTDMSYLPPQVRMWMAARIATLFENREQLIQNNQVEIPRDFADGVLDALLVGTRLF
jgi:uncharacterized phiE125 gp8 family phage protein